MKYDMAYAGAIKLILNHSCRLKGMGILGSANKGDGVLAVIKMTNLLSCSSRLQVFRVHNVYTFFK